jgi:hypothetical protein
MWLVGACIKSVVLNDVTYWGRRFRSADTRANKGGTGILNVKIDRMEYLFGSGSGHEKQLERPR